MSRRIQIFFIVCMSLISLEIYGQKKDSIYEKNLYYRALKLAIDSSDWFYSDTDLKARMNLIIVNDNLGIFDALPDSIDSYKIQFLNENAIINQVLSSKTNKNVVKVFPCQITGNIIKFRFTLGWFKYEKSLNKEYSRNSRCISSFGNGTQVIMHYNCIDNQFELIEVIRWRN